SGGISRGEEGALRSSGQAASPAPTRSLRMAGGFPASERQQYGGTLRMELGELAEVRGPGFISPLDESARVLMQFVYETLVRIDARGEVQPLLAESWERDASMRRWKFHLRSGVKFQDGTPLAPQSAVDALRSPDEDWRVTPTSDGMQIETPSASPDLPATLANFRYSLIRVARGEGPRGTGPFKIESWEARKRVVLSANVDYWGGRPFLDVLNVQLDRAARDRMIDLEVGKADLIELPAEMARRAGDEKIRMETTPPVELLAVVFTPGRAAADDARVREAVSRSIDRAAIVNLVLQKQGEAADGLLPQWISGTEFLFWSVADAAAVRSLVKEIAPPPSLVLGYDSDDALEQGVAERIAVNAKEAGIAVSASAIPVASAGARPVSTKFDARIVRVSLTSPLPRPAFAGLLGGFAAVLGKEDSELPETAGAAEIYARERAVIETYRIVPIAHLPRVYGLGARVRNWSMPPGTAMNGLPLADVWLEREAQ
ncbi:MAG: ABC transporter substrate-binding protein, partial [Candidatus Acidiferrales bacterium]